MYASKTLRQTPGDGAETTDEVQGTGAGLAQALASRCGAFLRPLLVRLDQQLDARLVRTVALAVLAVVRHRDRPHALLLRELGGYLAWPQQAPAGTKRLANVVHSRRWRAEAIEQWLLEQGLAPVEAAATAVSEGRALCGLDGSVLEKPESTVAEGLAPVRSSKARRLARPRPQQGPGYFRGAPGGPIVVPGISWLAALVTTWSGPSTERSLVLGAWHWYAHRRAPETPTPSPEGGVPRQTAAEAQRQGLQRVVAAWGAERLLHVWDRGLSGATWLGEALDQGWHFVVRWKKGNRRRPATAPAVGDPRATPTQRERAGVVAWRLTAGLRPWGSVRCPIRASRVSRSPCALPRDRCGCGIGRSRSGWWLSASAGAARGGVAGVNRGGC